CFLAGPVAGARGGRQRRRAAGVEPGERADGDVRERHMRLAGGLMLVILAGLLLTQAALAFEQSGAAPSSSAETLLEIRCYTIKAGERDRFHELFVRESLPLLRRWKVDVVAYGPSLHDRDSWILMRT